MFYLDDYNLICSDIEENFLSGNLRLFKNNQEIPFEVNTVSNSLTLKFFDEYKEGDVLKVIHNDNTYIVNKRLIIQTKKYEDMYCPDVNTLGSFYHKNYTTFRIWAPETNGAYVVINDEPYRMVALDNYIYEANIKGDFEGCKYHYDLLKEDGKKSIKDIFSYSVAKDTNDSYVIDLKKLKFKNIKTKKCEDPIIYELSVKDFSSDVNAPFINKGKFKAFTETGLKINNEPIGIDYLKGLGVSHIQLLPTLNFDLDGTNYNWGYNPVDYNCFAWEYVVKEDAYAPINEFREMVDTLHANDLKVNLDIVFNHIYKAYKSTFNDYIPYYFFRYTVNGEYEDGSWCGNEIRTEGKFVRDYFKLIIERLIKIYDIDGLRFDLAGLIDVESINSYISLAKSIKNDFMMYGEGWNMGEALSNDSKTCLENANKVKDFAFFNPYFRDNFKGKKENIIVGYLCSNKLLEEDIKKCLVGSFDFGLNYNQTINYVECHDNLTFYDQISSYIDNEEDRTLVCKSSLASVILSKGIPFIHAGQEFKRTKYGIDNSYNADISINRIDWNLMANNVGMVNYLKELIKFRKTNPIFRKENNINFSYYYDLLIYSIDEYDIFINPTEYPYVYNNWITYADILYPDTSKMHNLSVFDIPKYSFVITKKS